MPGKYGRAVALTAALLMATAGPAWADGQLMVKSHPRGAAIYIDGRAVGTAPLVVNLPPGQHVVQGRLKGHSPRAATVTVVDQLTTRATLALESQSRGELRVVAQPAGAQVYVNGRFAGASPVYLKGLVPGQHRVVAVRDGFKKSVQYVEIVAGLTSTSFHTLAATPVRAAERPAPRATARPVPPRPEPPRLIARAPAPERAERPAPAPVKPALPQPEARVKPGFTAAEAPTAPVVQAPVVGDAAAAPLALPAPSPWVPPLSPRELAFLLGMGTLLAALGLYLVRHLKRQADATPVLFPARPPRDWLVAPGIAFADATRAWQTGDVEGARAHLWAAVQHGTADAWHYYHLGLLAHREGKLAEAESAYRTALQMAPERPEAGYNLGVLLADFDQAPQAILAYRKHLEAHPDDVDALFNLGHLYLSLGMHQPASVHWTAARKLAPSDKQVRANLTFLLRLIRVQQRAVRRTA